MPTLRQSVGEIPRDHSPIVGNGAVSLTCRATYPLGLIYLGGGSGWPWGSKLSPDIWDYGVLKILVGGGG